MFKILYYRDLLRFFLVQRFKGFAVPDAPYFDAASTDFFLSAIHDCRSYLEYGSGGSTVVAAQCGKPFVSVDTDKFFLKSVGRKIGALSPAQRLVYADIGLTGPWGRPLRAQNPSPRRLEKWKAYAETPWRHVGEDQLPDLVLIDGRFRVASALACGDHLQQHPEARILVDDYADRPYYHVLEQYLRLMQTVGRMAVFQPLPQNGQKPGELIAKYSADWR